MKIKGELKSMAVRCESKSKGQSALSVNPSIDSLSIAVAAPKSSHVLGVFGLFGTSAFITSYLYLKAKSH